MSISYDEIYNKLASRITQVAVIEGSWSQINLSALTFLIMEIYGEIEANELNQFVSTADLEWVIKKCKERGIYQTEATTGTAKGKFDVAISSGSRFQVGEVVWASGDLIEYTGGYYYYKMVSEQTGTDVNKAIGTATAITYIEGLTYAYIESILILAEDAEGIDSLRSRYYASFDAKTFSGNKSAYKEFTNDIDGVGGCKVYPIWDGGGTVKVTIISSDYTAPTSTLITTVQNTIDPTKTGDGTGYAPIGHIVTIAGVTNQSVKIGVNATYETGYSFELCKTEMEEIIEDYFAELNAEWADSNEVIVRRAEIISRLLESEHIIDVEQIQIDDEDSNLQLDTDKIATLSELVEVS